MQITIRNPDSRFDAALVDLAEGARALPLWYTLGNVDVRLRFRRSTLGPLWVTLSFAITIAALGFVYGHILRENLWTYLPYLTIGLLLWGFVSQTLQEACDAYVADSVVLTQTYVPRSTCVYRILWRNVLVLALNATIVPIVYLISATPLSADMLVAVPGLLLLCLNLGWASLALAIACTRFRDLPRIVASAMQLLLLVTPVVWRSRGVPDAHVITAWNPLYYGIEIVRAPLLAEPLQLSDWTVATAAAIAGWVVTLALFSRYRSRITYWL